MKRKNLADGTVYGKYKKIKNGEQGVRACKDYIDDDDKLLVDEVAEEAKVKTTNESDVSAALDYIRNDMKTYNSKEHQRLITGVNCTASTAVSEFKFAEESYHEKKKEHLKDGQTANQAFHIILSYKGKNVVDPKLCHHLGIEFAKRVCGNEYQSVVATHLNTGNNHNHILINAYSIDAEHPHKFQDDYFIYKKFRNIANELSVEYGLPIFLDDGRDNEGGSKSWAELMKSQEGKSYVDDLRNDIMSVRDISDSYEEFLENMEELGYTYKVNPKSVTFSKDGFSVRDRRLGREYTRAGFEEMLENEKQKEERKRENEEIKNKRKTMQLKVFSIKIPGRYNRFGMRRPFLIRLLLLIKEVIKAVGDLFYSKALEERHPDEPVYMRADKKIALLDKTIETLQKYDITDEASIDVKLRELHAEEKPYSITVENAKEYLDGAAEIVDLIDEFKELSEKVRKTGIDPSTIIPEYDEGRVRRNLAELNPMHKKTRSDLFRALHDNDYRLDYRFDELSQDDARKILKAIREEKKADLPKGLRLKTDHPERRKKERKKKLAYNIEDLVPEKKEAVLRFKEVANKVALYGVRDMETADAFKADYLKKGVEMKDAELRSEELKTAIKDLYKLKINLRKVRSVGFSYGPLYPGDARELKAGADKVKKEITVYDRVKELNERLAMLPEDLNLSEYGKYDLPEPSEYRFLRDLEAVYPGSLVGIDMLSPRAVDDAVNAIRLSGALESEMKKALELEQAMDNLGVEKASTIERNTAGKMNVRDIQAGIEGYREEEKKEKEKEKKNER